MTAWIGRLRARLPATVDLRRTAGLGSWAVLDQALFAAANFVLNVLLARWLSPSAYGAFAVAYTLFLLLGTAHNALLIEPMLVFGPGKFLNRSRAYLAAVVRMHWGLTVALAGATAFVVFVLDALTPTPLTLLLYVMAAASPFILFQWLMRRSCYMRLDPRLSAQAGALYFPLVVAGTFVLDRTAHLSAIAAFIVLACASLATATWLAVRLGLGRPGQGTSLVRESTIEHWSYGRWALASSVLSWVPGNIFYLVLPAWGGLESTATLRALYNLVLPILHFNAAVGGILLPTLVRARERGQLRTYSFLFATLFAVASIAYYVLIVALKDPAIRLLYGDKYVADASLVWILGILPVTAGVVAVAGAVLRALERPDRVFVAYIASTAAVLSVGLGLVALFGAAGAALGMVVGSVATGLTMMWFLARRPGGAST
ncbi:MAG: oligosaccharide flippase family protein [Deinococcales bacterium]